MLNGYHLRGIEEEYLLVFRTDDPEVVLRIIARLRASRDKEIKALADILELDWNTRQNDKTRERQLREFPRKARPKNSKRSKNGVRD